MFYIIYILNYSLIAPTGQTASQAPHEIQLSGLIEYGLPSEIQSTGHSGWQAPQVMQVSLIT